MTIDELRRALASCPCTQRAVPAWESWCPLLRLVRIGGRP